MEERYFKEVRIMTSHPGRMQVVTSALQAAEQILTDWPVEEGEVLSAAKHALLSCLEGKLSPGSARVAFIQAARKPETTLTSRNVDRRPVSPSGGVRATPEGDNEKRRESQVDRLADLLQTFVEGGQEMNQVQTLFALFAPAVAWVIAIFLLIQLRTHRARSSRHIRSR
jgi:hypothetical protein